jgi:Flagellar hook-length control protein FliK
MNVNSLNIAPKPSGNKPIDNNTAHLLERQDNPNNFANTLKEQDTFFKETKPKEEPPKAQRSVEERSSDEDVKANSDDHQELAALLEKYFPPSTSDKETAATNVEPSFYTLTDGLVSATPTEFTPQDVSATQDMSSAIALTGLAMAKPAAEDAKTNMADDSMPSGVSLQKSTVFGQAMQPSKDVSLPSTDGVDTFKQTLTSLPGSEQKTPEVTGEILPIQKPVDTRIENAVITKPITHPGWSKDLGEQIIWLHNKDISAAEIKLNPANLGPISIKIDVNQDNQTSILFTAQHVETKEALEASIPKLKEMLLGQQLNLVNVNISQNSSNGRSPSQHFYGNGVDPNNLNPETTPNSSDANDSGQVINKGLLSLYA